MLVCWVLFAERFYSDDETDLLRKINDRNELRFPAFASLSGVSSHFASSAQSLDTEACALHKMDIKAKFPSPGRYSSRVRDFMQRTGSSHVQGHGHQEITG